MKKIITLLTLLLVTNTFAATEVLVYWTQNIATYQGQLFKAYIDNANKNQNKYQFVIILKPGAGGTIAATSTLNSNKPALIGSSSTFYARPAMTKDSHDPNKFLLMNRMCIDKPTALYSTKSKIEPGMSIGYPPGTYEAMALIMQKRNPSLNLITVPFKTSADATVAMLGGHLDISLDFLGLAPSIVRPGVNILGITGKKSINGIPIVSGLEDLVLDLFLFAPKNLDPALYVEFHHIFKDASNEETDSLCKIDMGVPSNTPLSAMEALHKDYQFKWKQLTTGLKL
jgi:tripartite-type tricarboxylate transporter receptor subunit TctC